MTCHGLVSAPSHPPLSSSLSPIPSSSSFPSSFPRNHPPTLFPSLSPALPHSSRTHSPPPPLKCPLFCGLRVSILSAHCFALVLYAPHLSIRTPWTPHHLPRALLLPVSPSRPGPPLPGTPASTSSTEAGHSGRASEEKAAPSAQQRFHGTRKASGRPPPRVPDGAGAAGGSYSRGKCTGETTAAAATATVGAGEGAGGAAQVQSSKASAGAGSAAAPPLLEKVVAWINQVMGRRKCKKRPPSPPRECRMHTTAPSALLWANLRGVGGWGGTVGVQWGRRDGSVAGWHPCGMGWDGMAQTPCLAVTSTLLRYLQLVENRECIIPPLPSLLFTPLPSHPLPSPPLPSLLFLPRSSPVPSPLLPSPPPPPPLLSPFLPSPLPFPPQLHPCTPHAAQQQAAIDPRLGLSPPKAEVLEEQHADFNPVSPFVTTGVTFDPTTGVPDYFGSLEAAVDYSEILSDPGDQGMCASCWAFAVEAAVQGAFRLFSGYFTTKTSLAVQQVLDCSVGGCRGGYPQDALQMWTQRNVTVDEVYPYRAKKGECLQVTAPYGHALPQQLSSLSSSSSHSSSSPSTPSSSSSAASLSSSSSSKNNHPVPLFPFPLSTFPTSPCPLPRSPFPPCPPVPQVPLPGAVGLMRVLMKQPVIVSIYASMQDFQAYDDSGSVYDNEECFDPSAPVLDHVVLVTGYAFGGASSNENYFIIRNSWGTTWGMNGYMFISMTAAAAGICGMTYQRGLYPVLHSGAGTAVNSYQVQGGDTCYGIYVFHGLSEADFLAQNQDVDCNNLQAGTYVQVERTSKPVCSVRYPISQVDATAGNCDAINARFSINAAAVNPGLDCANLVPGQQLCVEWSDFEQGSSNYVLCTQYQDITPTSSCSSIRSTYGLTWRSLYRFNPGLLCDNINGLAGQEVCACMRRFVSVGEPPQPNSPIIHLQVCVAGEPLGAVACGASRSKKIN
ncbi:unnamed protein product [Closterium sp. NIES-54]